MKNILKNKKASAKLATVMTSASLLMMEARAFCLGGKLNKILDTIWTLIQFMGIIMAAVGIVQLIRCVISLTGGDQVQPGQLGKACGLIAAGIIAATLKTLLTAITGVNVTL